MENISANIISVPSEKDWLVAKQLAYRTIGKTTTKYPDEKWKKMILAAY